MRKSKNSRISSGMVRTGAAQIRVTGAQVNNLRDFDCAITRHRLSCVCGVSGSGKSTLLFSVLAAESEARHQALLAESRRKAPASRAPAESVTGLPFSVTVSQRVLRAQKRSTVATQTGIHQDLITLTRHFGRIRCQCGCEVGPPSPRTIVDSTSGKKRGIIKIYSLSFRHGVGGSTAIAGEALHQGHQVIKQLDGSPEWKPVPKKGTLNDAIACAVFVGEATTPAECLDLVSRSLGLSPHGVLLQVSPGKGSARTAGKSDWLLDTSAAWPCPQCGIVHPRATGSLLSFNSAAERSGRCTECAGVGTVPSVALELLIQNEKSGPLEGALGLERRAGSFRHIAVREDTVRGVIRRLGATEKATWSQLPEKVRQAILQGTTQREQPLDANGRKTGAKVLYHGLIPLLVTGLDKGGEVGDYARSFVREQVCPHCDGTRFERNVVFRYEYASKPFVDILQLSTTEAKAFFEKGRLSRALVQPIEAGLLEQCLRRVLALERSGLGHLSLARSTASLSGGELQRMKISRSLVGGLTGSCYILDEPSLGLHAADNAGLIGNLRELRDAGNTVIVADHDPDFIRAADERLFLGPGAGRQGGRLLKNDVQSPRPMRSRSAIQAPARFLTIEGCSLHNIHNETIHVPLGKMVCLTGVSGSGKSTFSKGILQPALRAALAHQRYVGPSWSRIVGAEVLSAVVAVEQQALSRSRRSLVSTYAGLMDPIRELLADTETARLRSYTSGTFSCNRAEGWCAACQGLGTIGDEEEAQGVSSVCDSCRGGRFRDAILDCVWRERNIAQILDMEVNDAFEFFSDQKDIHRRLTLLRQLGLAHLKLCRPTSNLSGGEAQRLKLASGLAATNKESAGILFILDEPTAGLHGKDVQALLDLLDQLVNHGRNTVIIVEHDLSVIGASDYILDFGPGSAAAGGRVIASGTPAEISKCKASLTGRALKETSSVKEAEAQPPRGETARSLVSNPSVAAAKQFADFLHEHYTDDPAPDGDDGKPSDSIRPTYVVGDSGFPPTGSTLIECFRFVQPLDRLLQPMLRYQTEAANIVAVVDTPEELRGVAKKHCTGNVKLAWTLASDAIASGKATRSALVSLIRHAGEGGAKYWTDETAVLHSITDEDFSHSDPFEVCVLMEGVPRPALLHRGLQLGSGWVRVLELKQRDRWQVKLHLVDRPLSLNYRGLAGRTLRTGLLPKTSGSACPFCLGKGVVAELPEELVVAKVGAPPSDIRFYTPGAQDLLKAIFGRVQKNIAFFQREGLVKFQRDAGPGNWERQVLFHGYPWARFPIPGKGAAQKNADFHEWQGLFTLVVGRLHLAKDLKWKARVEAGLRHSPCRYCEQTGLDWSARHVLLGKQRLPDFLHTATFASLLPLLGKLSPESALRKWIADICSMGLGHLTLRQKCGNLDKRQLAEVRSLALQHLAFPEAGYVLSAAQRTAVAPSDVEGIVLAI